MYQIDNKFEIDEICWTPGRKNIYVNCPICAGKKDFVFEEMKIVCRACNKDGKVMSNRTFLVPVKVKIRRIRTSIWKDCIDIKYKVDCLDVDVNVNNRQEKMLFKTEEEAKEYCEKANNSEISSSY